MSESSGFQGIPTRPDAFRLAVNDEIHVTELRPGDKPALIEYLNEPEIFQRTLRIPFPYREADADRFLVIAEQAKTQHAHPVHFAIRRDDGRLIGGCGFDGLSRGHLAEIGYWLAKPYWGRGIMTAVVGSLCDFATAQWNLVRISAVVFEFNLASARVLEHNGFALEGVLRKYCRKNDRYVDARLYALVK